ncbi:MAG TPA: hypothetical protein VH144_00485 [Candidatus Saccharimonadales bacterium]|jgi:hypothetical protein|nr:hypothetical protein [Candidatus Saccharimonadales bacterium]
MTHITGPARLQVRTLLQDLAAKEKTIEVLEMERRIHTDREKRLKAGLNWRERFLDGHLGGNRRKVRNYVLARKNLDNLCYRMSVKRRERRQLDKLIDGIIDHALFADDAAYKQLFETKVHGEELSKRTRELLRLIGAATNSDDDAYLQSINRHLPILRFVVEHFCELSRALPDQQADSLLKVLTLVERNADFSGALPTSNAELLRLMQRQANLLHSNVAEIVQSLRDQCNAMVAASRAETVNRG